MTMLIQSVAGGEVSMALGGGTVKAGMAEMSPSSEMYKHGVPTYSTTMGGASVAVGAQTVHQDLLEYEVS